MELIYLDNNATTPLDPRVLEAMMPYFTNEYGNAASLGHAMGLRAGAAVDHARQQIADIIGAEPREIIFTSGATESNNLAIQGIASAYHRKGRHIITQATEHKAVLDTCDYLQRLGFDVTLVPVDRHGVIDLDELARAFTDQTILVSVMFANNEIGTLQPIGEISALCRECGALFHTDATQAFAKLPIDVEELRIDALSGSAHKIYGPKGVGFLYLRNKNPRVRCLPLMHGGGHEHGFRSGTLNVPGIVGMASAAELCAQARDEENRRLAQLRDMLWNELSLKLERIELNGHPELRLAGTANISFGGVEAESLMMALPSIAASAGSACMSAMAQPSHVLQAIGATEEQRRSSIRFSLGRFTTQQHIDTTILKVAEAVTKLRKTSPTQPVNPLPK